MPRTRRSTAAIFGFVALLTLACAAAVRAQPASGAAGANAANLAGRWRFTSYGSIWTVDLKLDRSQSTATDKVYCGEATRDRTMPDTPIIKSRVCAQVDAADGLLHVDVSGSSCRAPWQTFGLLEGTCSKGNAPMIMHSDDDLPSGGTMSMPMGGFTAMRVQRPAK